MLPADLQRLSKTRSAVVQCANVPDLALLYTFIERAQRLLKRRFLVILVRLVKVDVASLQVLQ